MAKKNNAKISKISFDNNLPQNILPIGERVEEDKNIYISQAVYKQIHQFTKNKTVNESGGVLVGNIIEAFGKTNIVIHGFVEAKHAEGTPTTLKFTHETWDYIHAEIEKKYEDAKIVGWIHTHPDFGIFLSEYDKFIQENFFKDEYQIAYVIDPIQKIEGFYFWINSKIERCKGFYIFDKTGETIDVQEEGDQNAGTAKRTDISRQGPSLATILLGCAMLVIIVALSFISINLFNRMKILESRQENLVESANQSISYLQEQISLLRDDLEQYENSMTESFIESDPIYDGLNEEVDGYIGNEEVDSMGESQIDDQNVSENDIEGDYPKEEDDND